MRNKSSNVLEKTMRSGSMEVETWHLFDVALDVSSFPPGARLTSASPPFFQMTDGLR